MKILHNADPELEVSALTKLQPSLSPSFSSRKRPRRQVGCTHGGEQLLNAPSGEFSGFTHTEFTESAYGRTYYLDEHFAHNDGNYGEPLSKSSAKALTILGLRRITTHNPNQAMKEIGQLE